MNRKNKELLRGYLRNHHITTMECIIEALSKIYALDKSYMFGVPNGLSLEESNRAHRFRNIGFFLCDDMFGVPPEVICDYFGIKRSALVQAKRRFLEKNLFADEDLDYARKVREIYMPTIRKKVIDGLHEKSSIAMV